MVNFSPFYQTTEPDTMVTTKIFSSDIVSVLCPEDILSSEVQNTSQVSITLDVIHFLLGQTSCASSFTCTGAGNLAHYQ